ncbi:LytTR family DNA-binding domain-containing protein [Massilia sp. 9096]|uniref:LytR/AlgR family response regulator transcription factor n=1 Tax=Massilia sp. 9096 TaxID=1500894 RepID=UPI00055EB722|nr:LytTR family DNA-binding domain-containing protein [Massilia sp. 9096]
MTTHPAPVRALIAEDEPILAATLAHMLRKLWPELEIAATAPNGIAAVEQALALRPDVLFLDIRMPGRSGIEAAEELAERWDGEHPFPLVVFVTAYEDYAVQAFNHAALDYVLKPVGEARLARTVERLRAQLERAGHGGDGGGRHGDGGLAQLVEQMRALLPPAAPSAATTTARLDTIRAAVGNVVRMIPVRDVLYFQALDKYVNVATAQGDALIRLSLKDLLAQLDPGQFCQISRSGIVNLRHVASASRDDFGKLQLSLRGRSEHLKVSPLFAHLFRQM